MKKFLLAAVIISISSFVFADELPIMIGVDLGVIPQWTSLSVSNTPSAPLITTSTSIDYLQIGCFFDFEYLRVDLGYQINDTEPNISKYSNGSQVTNYNDTNNFSQQNIMLQILGKFPIEITESFHIWPAMGFEYNTAIFSGHDNTNEITNTYGDMNTFYIKVGVGADIELSSNFYLEPMILFGWSLDNSVLHSLGITSANYIINVNVGAAYKF